MLDIQAQKSDGVKSGRWFSPSPPVSSTNKTNLHDITGILLKVALNSIKQRNKIYLNIEIQI
jgi:hypothetical protein